MTHSVPKPSFHLEILVRQYYPKRTYYFQLGASTLLVL